jgi:hypothetical protein
MATHVEISHPTAARHGRGRLARKRLFERSLGRSPQIVAELVCDLLFPLALIRFEPRLAFSSRPFEHLRTKA